MNQSLLTKRFDKFQTFSPDQPIEVCYDANQQEHLVVIQWMGEAKGVKPAYYVFEGEEYTHRPEHPVISPKELIKLTDEQLKKLFPDEKELQPAEATRVIEYIEGIGWSERGKGKTEHAEAIGKVIEKVFS